MIHPISLKKYLIYDIFHNDNNKIIIITPGGIDKLNIQYKDNESREDYISFDIIDCPRNCCFIYVSNAKVDYQKKIKLKINDKIVETNINKYPEFNNEIIMSTLVKNEDKYIIQWIKYNLNIGFKRFIIYDNSDSKSLKKLLSKYIKKNIVVLIKWNYTYNLSFSRGSGQSTQQNHCIYAFQNSKYIGMFDIDEYINMQNEIKIEVFLNNLIEEEKIDVNKIGSFMLLCKLFFNPNNLSTENFDFLKIYNCSEFIDKEDCKRNKHIVIPKNVSVYWVHKILKGEQNYKVDTKKIFFNHYFFLNRKKRGRDKTEFIDKSIKKHIGTFFKQMKI